MNQPDQGALTPRAGDLREYPADDPYEDSIPVLPDTDEIISGLKWRAVAAEEHVADLRRQRVVLNDKIKSALDDASEARRVVRALTPRAPRVRKAKPAK